MSSKKNNPAAEDQANDVVCCPYNKSHRVVKSRLLWHISKCKSAASQSGLVGHCRYNYMHIMATDQLMHHETKLCPDRPKKITREEDVGDDAIAEEAFKEWKRKQNKEAKEKKRRQNRGEAIPEVEEKEDDPLDFEIPKSKKDEEYAKSHLDKSQNINKNWLDQNMCVEKQRKQRRNSTSNSDVNSDDSIDSDDDIIVQAKIAQKPPQNRNEESDEEESKSNSKVQQKKPIQSSSSVNNNKNQSNNSMCMRDLMDDASFQEYRQKRKADKAAKKKNPNSTNSTISDSQFQLSFQMPIPQKGKPKVETLNKNRKRSISSESSSNRSFDSDKSPRNNKVNQSNLSDMSFQKAPIQRKKTVAVSPSKMSDSSESGSDSDSSVDSDDEVDRSQRNKLPFPYGSNNNKLSEQSLSASFDQSGIVSNKLMNQKKSENQNTSGSKRVLCRSSDSRSSSSSASEDEDEGYDKESEMKKYEKWNQRKQAPISDPISIEQSFDATNQLQSSLQQQQQERQQPQANKSQREELSEDENQPVSYKSQSTGNKKKKPHEYVRKHVQLHNLSESDRANYEQLQMTLEQELPQSIQQPRGNRQINSDEGKPLQRNNKQRQNNNRVYNQKNQGNRFLNPSADESRDDGQEQRSQNFRGNRQR